MYKLLNTKYQLLLLLVGSIGFFIACSPKLAVPVQADVVRGSEKFSNLTLIELKQGKMLYEQNCGGCHNLKRAFNATNEQIEKVMPEMAAKAKISSAEQQLILKYLLVMNRE